jgi:hypothetical protein
MLHLSLVFWLLLAVPGFALLCRLDRERLQCGLLGVLGLSYLGTFVLLTPISVLGYLFHLPIVVLSVSCCVLVAVGLGEIARRGWWREACSLLLGAIGLELVVLAADMVVGARVGAVMHGDAELHLARIRDLLQHGFNNRDPLVAGDYFFPIYHTNILHALYASCSQLTGVDYTAVWFASLPWGKLLIASGSYCLAWCVFGRRWTAWAAALFLLAGQAPIPFIIYPNKLAPLWLMPLMLSFAIEACRSPGGWRACLWLGAGNLVLGQVHSLYVVFVIMVIGPLLGLGGGVRLVRRTAGRWHLAACFAVLFLAIPFPVMAMPAGRPLLGHGADHRQDQDEVKSAGPAAGTDATFLYLDHGWVMKNPATNLGGFDGWRALLLPVGFTCALISKRRRQAALLMLIVVAAAFYLYVPPVCTALVRVFGATWMVSRLEIVLRLGFIAMVPATAAFLIESRITKRWLLSLLILPVPFAAQPFAHQPKPYDWQAYWQTAMKPAGIRRQALHTYARMTAFLAERLPSGETVLVDGNMGSRLVALYDCRLVVAHRSNNGVPGKELSQRRQDLRKMLDVKTGWDARQKLLRKYRIRFAVPNSTWGQSLSGHLRNDWRGPTLRLVELDVQ